MADDRISTLASLGRFLVVGLASFAADFGVLVLLHGVLHVALWLATTASFLASFAVNFNLNRMWTFRAAGGAIGGQAVRFVLLVVVNLALTVVIVTGLTALGSDYRWAKVAATALVTVINFVVLRSWVFRRPAR